MTAREETIQRRYESIIDQKYDWDTGIPKLEGLVQLTGIRPSNKLLRKIYLTALEANLTISGRDELTEFSKRYNLFELVSKSEVQTIYRKFLDEGRIHYVEDVAEVSGVTPEFDEEQVQRAYVKAFQRGICAGHISAFQRFSGIEPKIPEHLVHEKYEEYFSQDYPLSAFAELKKVTGVVPVLNPDKVRERFRTLLEMKEYRGAGELKVVLEIDFPEDVVFDLYSSMVENGHFGSLYGLKEFTRVPPKKELLEDKYRALLGEHDFRVARILKRDLEVDLKLDDLEVQRIFSTFSGDYFMCDVEDLAELTGISPNEENVQRWYASLVNRGKFDEVSELQKFTGIKPSREVLGSLDT